MKLNATQEDKLFQTMRDNIYDDISDRHARIEKMNQV